MVVGGWQRNLSMTLRASSDRHENTPVGGRRKLSLPSPFGLLLVGIVERLEAEGYRLQATGRAKPQANPSVKRRGEARLRGCASRPSASCLSPVAFVPDIR